jgi:hypothetical protein
MHACLCFFFGFFSSFFSLLFFWQVTDMTKEDTLKPLLVRMTRFCNKHTAQCAHCSGLVAARPA